MSARAQYIFWALRRKHKCLDEINIEICYDFRKLLNKIHVNGLTLPRATEKLGPPTERISLLGAYESFQSQKKNKKIIKNKYSCSGLPAFKVEVAE